MLNKVPKAAPVFWTIKILATTVGETCADFLAVRAGLGATTTRFSVAPLMLMGQEIALPTGTNYLRENSASRSRAFGPSLRAATGTKSFAVDRKKPFGSQKKT